MKEAILFRSFCGVCGDTKKEETARPEGLFFSEQTEGDVRWKTRTIICVDCTKKEPLFTKETYER